MSKTNDPSGTAIKVLQHPRLAWLIRKVTVLFVIAQYRSTSQRHIQYKHLPNYKLFRYEDLLAQPEIVLRELCEFIEVEFTEDLLHPEKGRHEHQPSSLTGKQRKTFDPAAAIRWQTLIRPFDKWLITALTKASMKRFAYNPETHPIFRMSDRLQSELALPASV